LNIREEAGRRWLCLGEKRILPIRPTFVGDVDEARDRLSVDDDPYRSMLSERTALSQETLDNNLLRESDPQIRVGILSEMGVAQALLFPSFGLFWPSVVHDGEVADANFSAWNNWVYQQSRVDPSKLLPVAQFSMNDPERTVMEIRRTAAMDMSGFFIRAVPYRDLPWGDPSNEAIWTALEEADIPLLLHAAPIGPIGIHSAWEKNIVQGHNGQPLQTYLNRALPAEAVIANLILEGVLERHPKLRIGVLEFGAIWVPSFLQRLDYTLGTLGPRNKYLRDRLRMKPSDYFRRQVKVGAFWSEPLQWLIQSAGPEVFMFSSDFPHPEGNESAVERAYRILDSMPPDTVRRFFSQNAQELVSHS
jgi:predicted TIM-barrel fold metal-dependent hydrolase